MKFKRVSKIFLFLFLGQLMLNGCGNQSDVINPKDSADAVEMALCADNATRDKAIAVVYTSRYGSTTIIAGQIAEELCEEGYRVEEKMATNTTEADLADYDAVIIGSPTMMGKWLPETLDFIERSADTLAAMTVAYINVNTTVADPEKAQIAYNAFIQPVLDDYPAIEPISVGLFAGEINYEEMYDQDRILLQLLRFEEGNWINLDAVDQWTSDFITELEAQ